MNACACCGEPGATQLMANGELVCRSCSTDMDSASIEELEAAAAILKRAAAEAREA